MTTLRSRTCKTVLRRSAGIIACAALLLPALTAAEDSPGIGAWQSMRGQLYGSRDINEVGEQQMSIEAPASTPDPAATPVVVHFAGPLLGKVKQVRVVIDNNPSPLAATFNLASALPVSEIDMRVRIDRFTSVRAIAETDSGKLEMRSTWVNASGGCSSPSSATEGGALGQIRFRASDDHKALQVSIRHPNNSGFQIDPRSGDLIPPHFVSQIRVLAGTQPLLVAETGISLSENPTLRIASPQALTAPLTVQATDLPTQAHYQATWQGTVTAAN
jgi:sulfur-oxidizing protein SoxY